MKIIQTAVTFDQSMLPSSVKGIGSFAVGDGIVVGLGYALAKPTYDFYKLLLPPRCGEGWGGVNVFVVVR
ncbi:hypothetical protein NIES4071_95380 [Calothrix sp. NIES-4071]|nr:hypothetical protein NIES4071_95380 [Calothrix sp. NIES-4071]BAZ63803.1 hypothetical protein NIES4105_95310 [Calothrix sp. NIES-4105]